MVSKKLRISHSSIIDFNNCSRLYYFKSIYHNPQTGNRIQLVNPYLSLGSAVHNAIDEIVNLSPSRRMKVSLLEKYEKIWKNYAGKRGGFNSKKEESIFKKRGVEMLKKVEKSNLLEKKSLKKTDDLPQMSLSPKADLVGSFDWVEILKNGNFHIIDFKTGRSKERKESWQLPIYQVLVQENYGKIVDKLSYWYLNENKELVSKATVNPDSFISEIKEKAREIQKVIENNKFSCSSPYDRCYWCRKYEEIFSGKAKYVGVDEKMKKDLYFSSEENLKSKSFYFTNKKKYMDERSEKLKKIKEEVVGLKKSPLYKERVRNKVFPVIGEGNHYAEVMFVGEAPGKNEALKGKPFCGNAGKILDDLLLSIKTQREDVYITNIVKDRPPSNRDPLPEEIKIYASFLDRQIDIIQPKIIVGLGRFSSIYLLRKFGLEEKIKSISNMSGETFTADSNYGSIKIIPVLHPASAIYDARKKETLLLHFKKIKEAEKSLRN